MAYAEQSSGQAYAPNNELDFLSAKGSITRGVQDVKPSATSSLAISLLFDNDLTTHLSSKQKAAILSDNLFRDVSLIEYGAIFRPDVFKAVLISKFFDSMDTEDKRYVLLDKKDILATMTTGYSDSGDKIMSTNDKIAILLKTLATTDSSLFCDIMNRPTDIAGIDRSSYMTIHHPKIITDLINGGILDNMSTDQKNNLFFKKDHGMLYIVQKWYDNKVPENDRNLLMKALIQGASYNYDVLHGILLGNYDNFQNTDRAFQKNVQLFSGLDRTITSNLVADYLLDSYKYDNYRRVSFNVVALNAMSLFDWDKLDIAKQKAFKEMTYDLLAKTIGLQDDKGYTYGSGGILAKIPLEDAKIVLSQNDKSGLPLAASFMQYSDRGLILSSIVNKSTIAIRNEVMRHVLDEFPHYSTSEINTIKNGIITTNWSTFKDSDGFSLSYLLKSCGIGSAHTIMREGYDTPSGFKVVDQKLYQEFLSPKSRETVIVVNGDDIDQFSVSVLHHKGFNVVFFNQKYNTNLALGDVIKGVKEYKDSHPDYKIKMLMLDAHGGEINLIDQHGKKLGQVDNEMAVSLSPSLGKGTNISTFLEQFVQVHSDPIDFVISSCRGQLGIVPAIKYLPVGSKFLALGEYNKNNVTDTNDANYNGIWSSIARRDDIDISKISAKSILDSYLTNLICYPSSPTYFEISAQDKDDLKAGIVNKNALIDLPIDMTTLRNKLGNSSNIGSYYENMMSNVCEIGAGTDRDNFYVKRCQTNLVKAFTDIEKYGIDILATENINKLRPESERANKIYKIGEYSENFTEFGNLLAIKAELLCGRDDHCDHHVL